MVDQECEEQAAQPEGGNNSCPTVKRVVVPASTNSETGDGNKLVPNCQFCNLSG